MNFLSTILVSICLSVTLAWDPSPTPEIEHYVLYAHTNEITELNYTNSTFQVCVGTNTLVRLEGLSDGDWWFAATALKGGLESPLSNVIKWTEKN